MDELKKAILYMGPVVIISQLHPLLASVGVVVIAIYALCTFVRIGVLPKGVLSLLMLAAAVVGVAGAVNWMSN